MAETSTDPVARSTAFATTSSVWQPRFRVTVGREGIHAPQTPPSIVVPTAISAMVQKSNWYQADRHKVVFALWGDPKFGYGFWQPGETGFDSMSIMVEISFDAGVNYDEVFRGFTDKVDIDPIKGTVTCIGRNIFGLLGDTMYIKTSENPSVEELINSIFIERKAKLPNLENVKDVVGQLTGRMFLNDQNMVSSADHALLNPPDVLQEICQYYGLSMSEKEGQVIFDHEINDNEVGFVIQAPIPDYSQQPGVTKLKPSNVTSLVIEHDLNISQWNYVFLSVNTTETGETVRDPYPDTVDPLDGQSKPMLLGGANRSPSDNKAYAQSMFEEFMLKEIQITAKVAGPQLIKLNLNQKIELEGTGTTPLDGWYAIDSLEHQIDFRKGYVGTVKGRYGRFKNAPGGDA